MGLFDLLHTWLKKDVDGLINHRRQFRLIRTVEIELIILGSMIIYVYAICKLWMIVILISIIDVVGFLNLWLLYRTQNILLCGHILTANVLVASAVANYLIGGAGSSYLIWLNVVPILAAITLSWSGLVIYSTLTLAVVIFFFFAEPVPLYMVPAKEVFVLNSINYLFSLMIVITVLFNMLKENAYYEQLLYEKNFMLQADKEKFHYLARYDTLTNLPNRSYFQSTLQNYIETMPQQHYLTVFFMDLDGFKGVNDRNGHEAGDALLLQAAKRLQTCFRENDFIARLGGDEFIAIVIHHMEDKTPKAIAQRILQEFSTPFQINAQDIRCTISIGLATFPVDSRNSDQLVARADSAMYQAKKAGGNAFRVTHVLKKSACKDI